MIKVIHLRAALDDYRTGSVDREELRDCAQIIRTAEELSGIGTVSYTHLSFGQA